MTYVPPHKRHLAGASTPNVVVQPLAPVSSNSSFPPPPFGANPLKPVKKAPEPILDPSTLDGNVALQEEMWDAMSRALVGVVNKVSVSNLQAVAVEAFRENIVRGRGVFVRALLRAQSANDEMTPVFACLVAIVNKEVPAVGELLIHRLLVQWKRFNWRGAVGKATACLKFLGHLMIHKVVDELLILKLLASYLYGGSETGGAISDNDIQIVAAFFKEVFPYLAVNSPDAFAMILDPLRDLVGGGDEEDEDAEEDEDEEQKAATKIGGSKLSLKGEAIVEKLLEDVKQWERVKATSTLIPEGLDLLDASEQDTHTIDVDDDHPQHEELDTFRHDPEFEKNEDAYDVVRLNALGEELANAALGQFEDSEDVPEDDDDDVKGDDDVQVKVKDEHAPVPPVKKEAGESDEDDGEGSETEYIESDPEDDGAVAGGRRRKQSLSDDQVVNLRKTMYLIIKNSMRAEEVVHKFFKHLGADLEQHEDVAVSLLMEGCYHEKVYNRFHVLIAERMAKKNPKYQKAFGELFESMYLENRLDEIGDRDIEKIGWFFAALLSSNSIHWGHSFAVVQLSETSTTPVQRIFLTALLQRLGESMGKNALAAKFQEPKIKTQVRGMFPQDPSAPQDTRFAVNFLEEIGVGLVADPLRSWYEFSRSKRARGEE